MEVVNKMLQRINKMTMEIADGDDSDSLLLLYEQELACLFQYVNMLNIKGEQKYIILCSRVTPATSALYDSIYQLGIYQVVAKM